MKVMSLKTQLKRASCHLKLELTRPKPDTHEGYVIENSASKSFMSFET
jgi:hypothetical protein